MSQLPTIGHLIGGQIVTTGTRAQDVFNPASGQVIAKLPHASRADLDHALASAQKAFQSWKHSSPMDRSKILRKVAENDYGALGDTSTLADPSVVDSLIENRMNR